VFTNTGSVSKTISNLTQVRKSVENRFKR